MNVEVVVLSSSSSSSSKKCPVAPVSATTGFVFVLVAGVVFGVAICLLFVLLCKVFSEE